MWQVNQQLIQLVAFIIFLFNTQFSWAHASADDEEMINKIVETHGKVHVVNFILENRNGKITIQKKKSFLNVTGKPDLNLVTAKSINNDLKILNMDTSSLELELSAYIEKTSKKQQKQQESLSKFAAINGDDEIPLSKQLKYKIDNLQAKYDYAEDEYDRKRLKKELSKLKRKYKEAKYNEKYNPGGNSSTSKKAKDYKKYSNYSSNCSSSKTKLQKLTEASFRHQVFYCNDISYRKEHPKTCAKYRYSKQYSIQQYKDELNRLRSNVSKYCKS